MTDKKDTPSSDAGAPKRPHATLDLKATEVKTAGAASSPRDWIIRMRQPGSAQSGRREPAETRRARVGGASTASSAKASGGSGGLPATRTTASRRHRDSQPHRRGLAASSRRSRPA